MGKRKQSKLVESKRKRAREELDALLASGAGVFTSKQEENSNSEPIDWENEEQDYELKPRSVKNTKVVEGLPIKTAQGRIERVVREEMEEEEEEEEESVQVSAQEAEKEKSSETKENDSEDDDEDSHLSPQEKLLSSKKKLQTLHPV